MELIFILVLMILLLGPEGMKRTIRQIGELIRDVRQSSLWKDIQILIRETQDLPIRLAREAGFEEQLEEIKRETQINIDLNDADIPRSHESLSSGKRRLRPPQRHGSNKPNMNNAHGETNEIPNEGQNPTEEIQSSVKVDNTGLKSL